MEEELACEYSPVLFSTGVRADKSASPSARGASRMVVMLELTLEMLVGNLLLGKMEPSLWVRSQLLFTGFGSGSGSMLL